jgi:pimeloyl-ACP methyl ester carboxylesterase
LALLDALHIDKFRAVGISTGGMTLLHMATKQPERVEAMALVGATHYFPKQCREIMAGVQFDNFTDEELALYRRLHKHGDEQIRLLAEQFFQFRDNYDDMNFTPPYLSTVTAKTLVLHGDRDKFFPVSIAVELYRSIPNSYLWIVPNGGHVPFDEDWKPDDTQRLLQFLKGEWDGKNSPR